MEAESPNQSMENESGVERRRMLQIGAAMAAALGIGGIDSVANAQSMSVSKEALAALDAYASEAVKDKANREAFTKYNAETISSVQQGVSLEAAIDKAYRQDLRLVDLYYRYRIAVPFWWWVWYYRLFWWRWYIIIIIC
ncbi:MAG TPA: hypothetical protein VFS21_34905 [Roseiflexaceae bacterium]|nr:hypothetical protein [Roseiflexaceae bacterium]